ncbi:hypothetical protein MLD38_030571 [Melastoma candidum]|uniref:Uncharacterized protein n=1 Tax=Melastoma candidum TaxID=119954 RepID=A0ACB9MP56_9MYRT|nr:hypothetical protein MLD38_030571 [Melastoma candidum]
MDVKGITWIGNMYQKFEAMCLEVEEIMYQDTVKFVEDQVESVGASVRKFYSEVMQDLDHPSSLDPGKVMAPEIVLEKLDAGKTYKRPTTCIKRVSAKTGPNHTKGSDVLGIVKKDGGRASPVKRLNIYRKPSSSSTQDVQLMKRDGNSEARSVRENIASGAQPQSEASGVGPPSERTETHSLQVSSENPRVIKHQDTTVNTAAVATARGYSMKDSIDENEQHNGSISDSSHIVPTASINIVDECIENNGIKTEISSSSADSDGTSGRKAVLPVTAVSDVREDSYFKIPVDKDGVDIAHASGNSLDENNLITLDKPDWGNLDESCILIDADGHNSISSSTGKRRSYKKTIRDAFSSKKKASRAQEYEQLALLYNDAASAKDCSVESGRGGTSEVHGSSECDWELL